VSHSEHYSYAHYADQRVAEGFDRLRFSGPIGELVAETQARVLLDFAGELTGTSVLDVGTGTGRAALVLARHGAQVTGVDASAEMLQVGEARARAEGLAVKFLQGDAHQLPFPNDHVDLSVSLRVLMHTPGWRQCIAELCRVTRRRIIIDYPASRSVAAVQALARRLKQALGGNTEAYRVFSDRAIADTFEAHGFRITRVHRLFTLPIAIHKTIGSRAFTERIEAAGGAIGLLRLFGSPVTVLAERRLAERPGAEPGLTKRGLAERGAAERDLTPQ
jgi:ubiquinone/menaquinone biosynthesis C-methylase UbiE